MISIDRPVAARPKRPLYLMAKPTSADRATLVRLCTMLDVPATYSPDRWHATFMAFGESSPGLIEAIRQALKAFLAEPFRVEFDAIRGNTLQKRKGLREPGIFQRRLAAHLHVHGIVLPAYSFDLHLNLSYTKPIPDRQVRIPIFGWMVEELRLIESVYGKGRHIDHGSLQLMRRQAEFDFLRSA